MSLFANKMIVGSVTRNDCEVIGMPFTGTKPAPGDVVKLDTNGSVVVTTNNTDRAYGVVVFYSSDEVCAVCTRGHVLAKLTSPTVGGAAFGVLTVVREMPALDHSGAEITAYEVEV